MSRRKQEKPLPRKRVLAADTDLVQDTLICGVCQKDFPLSDIVRFIQHKVQTCNKENYLLYDDSDYENDNEGSGVQEVVRSRRPSISAPISKKDKNMPRPSSAAARDGEEDGARSPASASLRENGGGKEDTSPKSSVSKDGVESATPPATMTNSAEPSSYTCCTCRHTFGTAWNLIQHVQNLHGLKIYVDTSSGARSQETSPVTSALTQQLGLDTTPHNALQFLRSPLSERQFGTPLNTTTNFLSRSSSHDFRPDLLGDQFHRLNHQTPLGITPFEAHRSTFDRTRGGSLSLGFEPQMDFYSQRLRQLAGATSPNSLASPRKLTSPFPTPPQPLSTRPSSLPSTPSSTPQPSSHPPQSHPQPPQSSCSSTSSKSSEQPSSPKMKSCEFCGKSFRFQSNLTVHRRSHTGEKPFKCHICNHACTQASKLKRHMKTHREKSQMSENASIDSGRSTPDSSAGKDGGHSNCDEDLSDGQGADNEEEEEEELDEDEEDLEEEDPENSMCEAVAEDLSTKNHENNEIKSENSNDGQAARRSLLGEVMEKIGLNNIQQYSEAYKQALVESTVKREKPSPGRDGSIMVSSGTDDGDHHTHPHHHHHGSRRDGGNKILGPSSLDFGAPTLLGAFDEHFNAGKRLKLDVGSENSRESLYAGVWLPSVPPTYRDLYLGMPPVSSTASGTDTDRRKSSSSTESALKSSTANLVGPPASTSPRPGTSGVGVPIKPKERRNDTCEYCGKVFKNCSNLTVHRRSHTGEKPYKCELCSYACAQSSKLTRHMKTHGRLGKDVYKCRFCDMPFSVPSTLEKHMRKCVVNQNINLALVDRDSDSKEIT
ncbi:B-cell lymphoma/leukemia 11A-like isoform X1 [Centruroides sculpturatus]|uniref:B-cell lymphoma/leukemia 11A-like isoform X1 n=1 Tax=Centruroides sculpturatus TaxID=218467 RepID=UPI000C6DF06B|nr:B-cell lymphoma/leukemia 11A-like isoform X1 [Centruroides sculpturatus]